MDKKTVYVWQLPISDPRCFAPVNYDTVNLMNYVLVYETAMAIDMNKIENYLEELYRELNEDYPEGYGARSMSASDLVVIQDNLTHETIGYVTDIVGFKKVNVETTWHKKKVS